MTTPVEVLREVFGYSEFRGAQHDIVDHICAGIDTDPHRYRLTTTPADESRARCCIIPPTVLAFRGPKTS